MKAPLAFLIVSGLTRTARAVLWLPPRRLTVPFVASVITTALMRGGGESLYNILWAVVFGFATLNILSLAARRFEPGRRGLTFGELLAIMVVAISVLLLGWEMLNLFHIFPLKLQR